MSRVIADREMDTEKDVIRERAVPTSGVYLLVTEEDGDVKVDYVSG